MGGVMRNAVVAVNSEVLPNLVADIDNNVSVASKKAEERIQFNCWGATLFVLGVKTRLYWEDELAMDRWLEENTKELYRPRKKGDILVVKDLFGILKHTAVYMGDGKYFHKRGGGIAEVTNLEGVRKVYPYKQYKFARLMEV